MIGVSGDGHKFPPFIIFKGSTGRTGRIVVELKKVSNEQQTSTDGFHLSYPLLNFYSVQPKAWMDTERMLEGVDKVWKPWTMSQDGPTLLILDEFTAHMTADIRNAISMCGTHLEFIPGGYTSRLQVMDVGLNKPFKNQMHDQYDEWFMTAPNGAKPQRTDVATLIANSWKEITGSMMTNTWHKVGLFPKPNESNDEDGKEDSGTKEDDEEEELDCLDFASLGIDDNNDSDGHHKWLYSDDNLQNATTNKMQLRNH